MLLGVLHLSAGELAGIAVAAVVVWLVVGVITTAAFAFTRVKMGKPVPTEGSLAWLCIGWPLTFFAFLGSVLHYGAKRMEVAEKSADSEKVRPEVYQSNPRGL